jgi:hypothetical protein
MRRSNNRSRNEEELPKNLFLHVLSTIYTLKPGSFMLLFRLKSLVIIKEKDASSAIPHALHFNSSEKMRHNLVHFFIVHYANVATILAFLDMDQCAF